MLLAALVVVCLASWAVTATLYHRLEQERMVSGALADECEGWETANSDLHRKLDNLTTGINDVSASAFQLTRENGEHKALIKSLERRLDLTVKMLDEKSGN